MEHAPSGFLFSVHSEILAGGCSAAAHPDSLRIYGQAQGLCGRFRAASGEGLAAVHAMQPMPYMLCHVCHVVFALCEPIICGHNRGSRNKQRGAAHIGYEPKRFLTRPAMDLGMRRRRARSVDVALMGILVAEPEGEVAITGEAADGVSDGGDAGRPVEVNPFERGRGGASGPQAPGSA